MQIFIWSLVLLVSLAVLVKAADYFTEYSEKLGLAFGLSSFIIGATIIAIGTSLPELVSSLFAVLDSGTTEFVVDNIVGSNVANALLILGIGALVAKTLRVTTSLIDVDLPFFFASMGLFVFFALDKTISVVEGIFLLVFFGIFLIYNAKAGSEPDPDEHHMDKDEMQDLNEQFAETDETGKQKTKEEQQQSVGLYMLYIFISIIAIAVSAKYLIDSVLTLSDLLGISSSLLTITVVAFGTSLPEVLTSIAAIKVGNHGMAIGNVFGSNTFNLLLVAGLPAMFGDLAIADLTYTVGLPFLVLATFVAIFVTFDNKIRLWEGAAMLFMYAVFLAKITEIM